MIPSIFNDVIGPVMRGPSSSHCAAANRIGLLCRDLMNGKINSARIQFDINGSLATTHESQGSDMGLFGGLLGMDCTDERLPESDSHIKEAGIDINIEIGDFGMEHPNTYRLHLENETGSHTVEAVSTGGGMIEITEIDGVPTSICGDAFEALVFTDADAAKKIETPAETSTVTTSKDDKLLIRTRSAVKPDTASNSEIILNPVLPALSPNEISVPFATCETMLNYKPGMSLCELAQEYESARTHMTKDEVFGKMREIVETLRESIEKGLHGTEYKDRILHSQSPVFKEQMDAGKLLEGGALNLITLYASALMEMKSSMGIIVASPTAGACAALPAACIGTADFMRLDTDDVTRGMLAAGMIGILIATRSTFAAEVAGCQAECGSASGMAAAGLTEMMGGTAEQAAAAASMALQNSFGMVCDPIANRVEAPCLGKNVMAAANAFTCANMALAGYDQVIPLDEVISAMDDVGKSIDHKLRCTALGGLSVTPTSKRIEDELKQGTGNG